MNSPQSIPMATAVPLEEIQAKQANDIRSILEQQNEIAMRKVVAFEMIADALQSMAKVQWERFRKDFPQPKQQMGVIGRASADKAEQYSDKPSPGWVDETEQALPQTRFSKRKQEQEAERDKEAAKE